MGKIIIPASLQASWDGLLPETRAKFEAWVAPFSFNLSLNSAYRSNAEQQVLYDEFLAGKRAQANRPGFSPHNWRVAIDVTPQPQTDANYQIMADTAAAFGIKREPTERWHFQDNRFSTAKINEYLKQIPAWLSGVATSKKGIAGGLTLALGLTALLIVLVRRRRKANQVPVSSRGSCRGSLRGSKDHRRKRT